MQIGDNKRVISPAIINVKAEDKIAPYSQKNMHILKIDPII